MNEKATFRFDINALRAIAVIAVMLFHFKVPFFSGGFSGVDIFYVISGFLMTGIIIMRLEKSDFSIVDFYLRRVQRIIPALIFLVGVIIVFCYFIYLPADFRLLSKNAAASLLFISNMVYANKGDYFGASSDSNIFLHTWSLSVEWQFYLILPIVLVVLNRFYKNDRIKFLFFFLVATLISFIFSLILSSKNITFSFYFLPSRSWEMMVGGIAFLIQEKIPAYLRKGLSILGYIVLLVCIFLLNDALSWPGYFTLIPVFGTFIILISNTTNRLITANLFLFFGKISYSLYLWHWPVYVLFNYLGLRSSISSMLLLILISIILGSISYKYIESINVRKVRYILLTGFLLTLISVVFWRFNTNFFIFKSEAIQIADYHERRDLQYSLNSCYINSGGLQLYNKSQCMCLEEGKKNVILLGDSHGAHLSWSLRENLKRNNIHMNQATAPYCLPILKRNGEKGCSDIMDYVYHNYIPKHANKIDGVMISANWLVSKDLFELGLDLKATIEYLHKLKIKVVIIGQNETYNILYRTIAAREIQYNSIFSDNYISEKSFIVNNYLKLNFKNYYIDIFKLKSFSKLSVDSVPYMMDENHFTKYGADMVTKEILKNKIFLDFIK